MRARRWCLRTNSPFRVQRESWIQSVLRETQTVIAMWIARTRVRLRCSVHNHSTTKDTIVSDTNLAQHLFQHKQHQTHTSTFAFRSRGVGTRVLWLRDMHAKYSSRTFRKQIASTAPHKPRGKLGSEAGKGEISGHLWTAINLEILPTVT